MEKVIYGVAHCSTQPKKATTQKGRFRCVLERRLGKKKISRKISQDRFSIKNICIYLLISNLCRYIVMMVMAMVSAHCAVALTF